MQEAGQGVVPPAGGGGACLSGLHVCSTLPGDRGGGGLEGPPQRRVTAGAYCESESFETCSRLHFLISSGLVTLPTTCIVVYQSCHLL